MTCQCPNIEALGPMAASMAQCDNFVICGHVSPDGDCLGSQLCLYWALRSMGKNVTCVLAKPDPIGLNLQFLPGIDEVVPAKEFSGPCDTFVAVDVSGKERLGDAATLLEQATNSFTLDHHHCAEPITQQSYVDPESPSASMIVWQLVKHLVTTPSKDSATCAYTGLLTDTGGFCHQNTTAEAFACAQDLMNYGANPSAIATQVFQNRTLASLKLAQICLQHMEVFAGGAGVISWITSQDMESCGANKSDAEPLIDTIRSLSGTRVACMLREQEGVVRGSLRAKDATDVSVLARKFEGGGHKASAGLTLKMPITEAVALMKAEIAALLED